MCSGLRGAAVSSSSSKSWCLGQDGEVSCHGKPREEVSVSYLDQSQLSLSAPGQGGGSLSRSETAPAKGSPSPPSVLILQNPEFLHSAEHPWLLPAAQCPAQSFVELLSAKETPFLHRHFSGQTGSQLPATLPRLEKVILECLSHFFLFFFTLNSARHRFGMEKPGSCLGQGCSMSLGVAVGASTVSWGSVGR